MDRIAASDKKLLKAEADRSPIVSNVNSIFVYTVFRGGFRNEENCYLYDGVDYCVNRIFSVQRNIWSQLFTSVFINKYNIFNDEYENRQTKPNTQY